MPSLAILFSSYEAKLPSNQYQLVRSLEPERGDVGPGGHLDVADLHEVKAVGDHLPQGLVRGDAATGLVDVGELDRLTDPQGAGIEGLEADDRLEQGRLADTVGTDHPDDPVAREREGQPVDQHPVVEALAQVLGLDHQRCLLYTSPSPRD